MNRAKDMFFWCFWKQTLLQIASRYNRWKSKTLRNRSRSTKKSTKIQLFPQTAGGYNRWKSTLWSVFTVFKGKLTIWALSGKGNQRYKPLLESEGVPRGVWSITKSFLPSCILPSDDFQSFARVLQLSGRFLSFSIYCTLMISRVLIHSVPLGKWGLKI